MTYRKCFTIGLIVLAALAVEAAAAPKRTTPKKPIPKPDAAEQRMMSTTFVTYDVGTLHMTGKSVGDANIRIGTLRMTGRAGTTVYNIGTLSMNGLRER